MSCGIYKIENLINHKCYIGQSKQIEVRWKNHISCANNSSSPCYNYPLYKAIRKYGLNNFSFSILEECSIIQLDKKEEYYIQVYDSLNNGYNQVKVEQSGTRLTPKLILNIIEELKTNTINTTEEIGQKFGVSGRTIRSINTGESWYDDNINYPIRSQYISSSINGLQNTKCILCGKKIYKGSTYCIECAHKKQYKCEHPSREELKNLIRIKPFTQIAEQYGVSDKSIVKWCKAEKLPYRKKDIKSYSDKEWINI